MRKLLLGLAIVAASLGFSQQTEASFIIGQQAFSSDATTSSPGNLIGNSTFSLSFSTLLGGTNQTGGFIGSSGAFVNIVDTTSSATLSTLSFGGVGYGTFTVAGLGGVNVNVLIPGVSRTINLSGTFTPDSAEFGPGVLPSPAVLTITINQAAPGVLSGSATLATSIPEPTSMVLLGTFCGPVALGLIRRRRSLKAAK